MSFLSMLNRRVQLVDAVDTTDPATRDRYGNIERQHGPPTPDVPARRNLVDATEDLANRDQETRHFLYFLALRDVDGGLVHPTGRGWIIDVDDEGNPETLEIIGEPELLARRRLPHHWEARARKVTG